MPRTPLLFSQLHRWTQRVRTLITARLAEHDSALDALEAGAAAAGSAATALTARTDALEIKTKYTLALINRIHMEVDFEGVIGLAVLGGGASGPDCYARANALRTALGLHMLGVGTIYVDGEHVTADTALTITLNLIPDATDDASCIVLILGLLTAVIAHGDSYNVHFNDDMGAGGVAATITVNPPVITADMITDLNDIRQAMLTHFSAGSQ